MFPIDIFSAGEHLALHFAEALGVHTRHLHTLFSTATNISLLSYYLPRKTWVI